MKLHKFAALSVLIAAAAASRATVLTFDDLADGPLTNQYAGWGVLSDGNSWVWGGIGNGDPGNWGLFGTNGSKFLGNNGGNNYQTTLYFTGASGLSFDISESNGSSPTDQWYAQEYNGSAQLVSQQSGTFMGVNDWTHVSFTDSGIDTLVIYSVGGGFHPYGVDNVQFNATPEPASVVVLGLGALGLIRRRRARRS